METQSPQLSVARQLVSSHLCDVVEGQIKSQSSLCHHGNAGESIVRAVTGEAQVTAIAGRPLTPAQGEEGQDEGQGKVGRLLHPVDQTNLEVKKQEWTDESDIEPSEGA